MKLVKMFLKIYRLLFWSVEKQARYVGVTVGKGNFLSSRFWSSEPYLITIGDYCALTEGVKIHTHGGAHAVYSKVPNFDVFGKVKLGNYVYVGNNAQIMPGVTVGDNVIIAAGSIVTKSVPSNVVVGGNPAKILSTLDSFIEKNIIYNLNSRGFSREKKKLLLLSQTDDMFIHKDCMKL